MGKRRISQNLVEQIGEERISRLLDLSCDAARAGSGKTRVPMPKDRPYCGGCLVPLLPGVNCRVRVDGHMVRTTCGCCGEIARRPYIREQSHEREGRQEGADEARQ